LILGIERLSSIVGCSGLCGQVKKVIWYAVLSNKCEVLGSTDDILKALPLAPVEVDLLYSDVS
jgi:hypothetical protein